MHDVVAIISEELSERRVDGVLGSRRMDGVSSRWSSLTAGGRVESVNNRSSRLDCL